MAGEGERGPSRTEDATAPDITMSPSWRVTGEKASGKGDEGGGPDEPRLLVAVAVAAASEIGGQGAWTILRVRARETAAAERIALVAMAAAGRTGPETTSASLGGASDPLPRPSAQPRKVLVTVWMWARRSALRASVPATRRRRRYRRSSRPLRTKAKGICSKLVVK
jgi:hypothetical protein